jgi:uncharacterized lipoprotein YajG
MNARGGEFWRLGLVCLAAVVLLAGCKKTARELAEQKALERHERETA